MKEQLDLLRKLQLAENRRRGIELSLKQAVDRLKALDGELDAFRERLADMEVRIEEAEKRYRSLESDAGLIQSQIKSSEAKLRSVKTNREYQSLLKEIDELKKKYSAAEDEMIQCLDAVEIDRQELAAAREEFEALQVQIAADRKQVEEEKAEGEEAVSALQAEKERLATEVDAKLMKTFEFIRAKKGDGMAIVRVRDAVCLGCNVNIPPQLYNELQRGDSLKFCPNCQRIIYWREEVE